MKKARNWATRPTNYRSFSSFRSCRWRGRELNVVEQVASACRTTVVQEAWENGRELSVCGLVDDRQNVLLADFHVHIGRNDSLSTEHAAAIAAFSRRSNLRLKRVGKLSAEDLAFQFQTDDKEKYRHQSIVYPMMQTFGNFVTGKTDAEFVFPKLMILFSQR